MTVATLTPKDMAKKAFAAMSMLSAPPAECMRAVTLGDSSKFEAAAGFPAKIVTGKDGEAFCKKRNPKNPPNACYDWSTKKLYVRFDPAKMDGGGAATFVHELIHACEQHSNSYPTPIIDAITALLPNNTPERAMLERNATYFDRALNQLKALPAYEKPLPAGADIFDTTRRILDIIAAFQAYDLAEQGFLIDKAPPYPPNHKDLKDFLGIDIAFERVLQHYATGAAGERLAILAGHWKEIAPIAPALEGLYEKTERAYMKTVDAWLAAQGPGLSAAEKKEHRNAKEEEAILAAAAQVAEYLEMVIGPEAAKLYPGGQLPRKPGF
ncbi:hypothetical protein C8J27_101811 [Rhodobacter aestuarii]|uniref:Uncharacterized protein n=1 Tax=Rhodobacter aestuarii TaxID=453582 RepID=A0A1N7PA01_9RHOB|nr:hypothetical protein [Rhodobacter aestuarii]PTV97693.1 hypothetical protein C8J27_101811 [Rhodobacter aestuarii]SIT07378.1 hypothetical protein SAMN05421580_109171 [Rhodobacter aestuarii]